MASKKKSIADLAASIEAAESKPVMYGPKKKRGRPKGSKKASKKASTSAQPAGKKRRGRPKGSRNSKASSAVQVVSTGSAGGRGRPKGGAQFPGGLGSLASAVKVVKKARDMLADAGCEIRNNF